LTVAIGKAGESGDTGAFDRLGLNFEQLRSMSPEEQFRAIAAAISALPGEAERAAAAVAIFGKSGAQLVPFLGNLEAIEARAKKLGIVLSEQQVGNIAGMNDALDLVSKTFDGIIGQVVGNLSPAITAIAEQFLQFVESFNGTGGTGLADAITGALFDGAEQLAMVFDSFSVQFGEWLASMGGFEGALKTTGENFATAGNVLMAVSESFRYLFNVFETFGNGLAIALGKVIENIGWLFGDESAQEFGKGMADAASVAMKRNQAEYEGAKANANAAADRAIFGGEMSGEQGAASTAVAGARAAYDDRNSPEAKSKRDQAAAKRESDRWWEGMQRRADESLKKQAEAAQKKAEEDAKADEAIQKAASGQAAAFQKLTQSASDFGAAGEAAAQEYRDELIKLTSQLDAGMINETTFNENANKLKDNFKEKTDAAKKSDSAKAGADKDFESATKQDLFKDFSAANKSIVSGFQSDYADALSEAVSRLNSGSMTSDAFAAETDKLKEQFAAKVDALKSTQSLDKAAAGASEFQGKNAALLGTKSKEALQANDIRSSEGISQFMALATGRDDPALVEYRKQTSTLMQLLAEQRAQRLENATILGGAAA
jgi:hypothetical protein